MKNRSSHLAREISRQLSFVIQEDFPDVIVTITDVVVTSDLKSASIWVKILGTNVFSRILKNSSKYRELLAHSLSLRRVPDLKFISDDTNISL